MLVSVISFVSFGKRIVAEGRLSQHLEITRSKVPTNPFQLKGEDCKASRSAMRIPQWR